MECSVPIVEAFEAKESNDLEKLPNSIMDVFQTDIFLSDKPQMSEDLIIEGCDGFHKAQMSLYQNYSDGSVF